MVIACILCKKESTFLNEGRSFHKFPNDEKLKKEWLDAIGLTVVCKTAMICSDHFDESAFHDTVEVERRKKRRLLSNAVPKRQTQSAEAQRTTPANMLAESLRTESESGDILASTSSYHCSDDEIAAPANDSMKRKRSVVDERPKKKVRFTTGFATEYISRNDFVSDDAWQRFMRFTRFPMENHLRHAWVDAMGRSNWSPTKYSKLCSHHFKKECFVVLGNKKYLLPDAIPTVFARSLPQPKRASLGASSTSVAQPMCDNVQVASCSDEKDADQTLSNHVNLAMPPSTVVKEQLHGHLNGFPIKIEAQNGCITLSSNLNLAVPSNSVSDQVHENCNVFPIKIEAQDGDITLSSNLNLAVPSNSVSEQVHENCNVFPIKIEAQDGDITEPNSTSFAASSTSVAEKMSDNAQVFPFSEEKDTDHQLSNHHNMVVPSTSVMEQLNENCNVFPIKIEAHDGTIVTVSDSSRARTLFTESGKYEEVLLKKNEKINELSTELSRLKNRLAKLEKNLARIKRVSRNRLRTIWRLRKRGSRNLEKTMYPQLSSQIIQCEYIL